MNNSSLPNRSSISPFRKTFLGSQTLDDRSSQSKKRQSLRIVTDATTTEQHSSSPSRVRQRLSSLLFRTPSPVVMTIKETFSHKKGSASSVSLSTTPPSRLSNEEETDGDDEDIHSTTHSLSSSSSSDHLPASPADPNKIVFHDNNINTIWQPSVTFLSENKNAAAVEINQHQLNDSKQWAPPSPPPHRTFSSLAFQVHQILGSTLDEVDEEIDQDWEKSRRVLRQSLIVAKTDTRNQLFWL